MKNFMQVLATITILTITVVLLMRLDRVPQKAYGFSFCFYVVIFYIVWRSDDFHRWLFSRKKK